MSIEIVDLRSTDTELIKQTSQILVECFRKYSPSWVPDEAIARSKIEDSFNSDRCSRVMLNEEGEVLGWIGGITGNNNWEIHPIAVKPDSQRKGYGKALVEDLSVLARESGAVSVWAGTGDELKVISFSNTDLYESLDKAISEYSAPEDHPVHFWSKIGFSLVGVLPDEEGLGKPGIHFAKRIV